MASYARANARCALSIGIGIAALAICTPVLAQTSPFLTGAIAEPAIQALRGHFNLDAMFTEAKAIDTLLWGFGKFLRSGAVRSEVIVYA